MMKGSINRIAPCVFLLSLIGSMLFVSPSAAGGDGQLFRLGPEDDPDVLGRIDFYYCVAGEVRCLALTAFEIERRRDGRARIERIPPVFPGEVLSDAPEFGQGFCTPNLRRLGDARLIAALPQTAPEESYRLPPRFRKFRRNEVQARPMLCHNASLP